MESEQAKALQEAVEGNTDQMLKLVVALDDQRRVMQELAVAIRGLAETIASQEEGD